MNPERFQRVMEVFEAARKLQGDDRRLHLETACAGDRELRQEVDALLVHHEDEHDVLQETRPPRAADLERWAAWALESESGPGRLTRWQRDKLVCRVAIDLGCITPRRAQDFLRRYRKEGSRREVATALLESKLLTRAELATVMEAFGRRLEALGRGLLAGGPARESAPWLGKTIGEYRVEAVLGRGGMGQVYRARHVQLGHEVALKVLGNEAWSGTSVSRRFVREAEIAAKLKHRHIVSLRDFGTIGSGAFYYTMDLVEGEDFASMLKRELPHPRLAARFVATVATAVHYAHTRKVIHRDLKPQNIMVTRAGEPVILDFGLAKELDAETSVELSQSGMVIGTPCYMSPEQVDGQVGKIDVRSDVYALGAILYESLTGRPPFVGKSQLDLMLRIRRDHPISPRQLNPAVPAELEAICLKCLEKARARRYESAEELANDLEALLQNRPVRARPPSALTRAAKFVRRHTALVGAAALVILSLVVGLSLSIYQWQRAEEAIGETQVAILARDLALGQVEEEKITTAGLTTYVDGLRKDAAKVGKLRRDVEELRVALKSAETTATRVRRQKEIAESDLEQARETARRAGEVAKSTLELYERSQKLNRWYETRVLNAQESFFEAVGLIGFLDGVRRLLDRIRHHGRNAVARLSPVVAAGKLPGRRRPRADADRIAAVAPGAPREDPEPDERRSDVKIRTDHPEEEDESALRAYGAVMRRRAAEPRPAIRSGGASPGSSSGGASSRGVPSRAGWGTRSGGAVRSR